MKKKIYVTPLSEEVNLEPMGCIMEGSAGFPPDPSPAPRRRGDIIE
jgi:hypothetical protein